MKYKVEKPRVFAPVSLTITFESQEEIDSFNAMCGLDVSVAELVADKRSVVFDTKFNKGTLTRLIGGLYGSMDNE